MQTRVSPFINGENIEALNVIVKIVDWNLIEIRNENKEQLWNASQRR